MSVHYTINAVERPVSNMAMTAGEIDIHVGQTIRRRREALGISQGRLARHLGLTFSQVQKYEKGANRIGAGRLYLIASFLGVSIQYFFEGSGATQATAGADGAGVDGADVAVLENAFLSIADIETRRSLLALVCALAASEDPSGRVMQSAG